jgi:hypothetical protein
MSGKENDYRRNHGQRERKDTANYGHDASPLNQWV